jgi:hypothetical protein
MTHLDPRSLKGTFLVPGTGIASVFGGRNNPRRRLLRRD